MARILVTDDDAQQLMLRKLLLEMAGHQVAIAFNAPETLRQLEKERPGVLIMDLRLYNVHGEPDPAEGRALIRRVREFDSRLPVIVLSGWPDDLYGQPEEQMVSRLFVKPVSNRQLLQAIEELTAV